MRLIGILIALLIVGLIIMRQLGGPSTDLSTDTVTANPGQIGSAPKVPQRPQELPAFEKEVKTFIDQQAAQRRESMD